MFNQETVNSQFLNHRFLEALDSPEMTKEAGVAMSAFVRQKLREDGFTRKILPLEMVTSADLDPDLNSEEPRIICEKEIDSVASTVPLLAKSEIRYYKGSKYEVVFEKIQTDEFKKSKWELMTYKTDIRGVLQANSLKDLQEQEDRGFITSVDTIAAANGNTHAISKATEGGLVSAFMACVKKMTAKRLPVGTLLMTQQMYLDLLKQPATTFGDSLVSGLVRGETGLDNFYGYRIVTTIKNDIIADDKIYVFTTPQYFGQFYGLQDATVFLKTEMDQVSFQVYESIGIGIGNINAAQVCTIGA